MCKRPYFLLNEHFGVLRLRTSTSKQTFPSKIKFCKHFYGGERVVIFRPLCLDLLHGWYFNILKNKDVSSRFNFIKNLSPFFLLSSIRGNRLNLELSLWNPSLVKKKPTDSLQDTVLEECKSLCWGVIFWPPSPFSMLV